MKVKEGSEKADLKLNIQKTKFIESISITSCQKDGKKWKQWQTSFSWAFHFQNHCSDCSHEIKRCLFLGRKAMTILDSILKSRDITLPTKVHIVKAVVFPGVIYGCERWTIKKAECQRIDAFKLVLEKTLESPLNCMEIKPVSLKGNQSWVFIGRTVAEAPILQHLMARTDSLEKTLMLGKIEGRRRRGLKRVRWLDGITDSMDMSLSKLREIVKDKPGMLQSVGSQRVRHDWVTEQWQLWHVRPDFFESRYLDRFWMLISTYLFI